MSAWANGIQLGPYVLLAPIGEGGMGEVWKARDTRLDRIVAIKRLKAEHSERFQREARAIAALNHPHICQIYDVGPDYLVMEFVEGKPLKGPLALEEALRLAIEIAGALEEAHDRGILHRDLKPGNILVTDKGSAKLLDFGLAKLVNSDSEVTMTIAGAVMGTPAYMSPEQAEGKPVDERSDVFSFGAVLYEMLCGKRSFTGMAAVLRDAPAPIESPAAAIVTRCLAKQPGKRFQTMRDVKAALVGVGHVRPTEQGPSIAVLPFANMSRDADDEYFSDGLAEEIINLLAHVPGLKVTARTSAFAFRGKDQDIIKIAEVLRVRTVLEGSVRRAGNRIRVTAQLINAEDGYHLWSERYDRELTDVFAIQDEIAEAIAGALQVTLSGKPAHHTPPLPAYEALLKGRHHVQRFTPQSYARAKECFEQAIALDPAYAAPHADLGVNYLLGVANAGQRMREVAPLIRSEARKALELDPSETSPHFLLGSVAAAHDYDWPGALREFQLAMTSPSVSAEAHWAYACLYLNALGRFEDAVVEMRRAVEQDPLNVSWRGILMANLVAAGRLEEALQEGLTALEIEQSLWVPYLTLGEVYWAMRRYAESAAALERGLLANPGNALVSGFLAAALVRLGEKDRAEALIREIGESPKPLWGLVFYHAACSDMELAAHWYQKMIEEREFFAVIYARSTHTKELRASPHWPKLAKMMNLSETTV